LSGQNKRPARRPNRLSDQNVAPTFTM
jgi:hypothetical protein